MSQFIFAIGGRELVMPGGGARRRVAEIGSVAASLRRTYTCSEGVAARVNSTETEWRDNMVAARAGDLRAYEHLLVLVSARLRAFVHSRLSDALRGDVEDVVQETLLAIHLHRDRYDASKPIAPWIYAIARYKLIDHCRRRRKAAAHIALDSVEEFLAAAEPEEQAPNQEVFGLLDQLPAKQQTAIRLVKLQAMSVREASARSGMSESAIKVSIHRGVKRLIALAAKAKRP